MKVSVLGLGKLGLPVALAIEAAGHRVSGWDSDPRRVAAIRARDVPDSEFEPQMRELLVSSRLEVTPDLVATGPDVVLVCVQTPHKPQFEGTTPLTEAPEDFDYTQLSAAVGAVADEIRAGMSSTPLMAIVSTCLPGTFDRELRPLTAGVRCAYMPLFIAMGSVIQNLCRPEFVLIGSDGAGIPAELEELQTSVTGGAPFRLMSIRSAELTKVAYNAWLGYKLMLANGIAMTCDAVGADCDDVMGTLMLATDRLISPRYMRPGMGDGGGCHPRDQIALSWLAEDSHLPHDPYRVVVDAREAHARWIADIWLDAARDRRLELIMLGEAYKPGTRITTGSHARLVAHYASLAIGGSGGMAPGSVRVEEDAFEMPKACYLLAVPHQHFVHATPPVGSVVVDPWGLFPVRNGVEVIRPGRRARHPDLANEHAPPRTGHAVVHPDRRA